MLYASEIESVSSAIKVSTLLSTLLSTLVSTLLSTLLSALLCTFLSELWEALAPARPRSFSLRREAESNTISPVDTWPPSMLETVMARTSLMSSSESSYCDKLIPPKPCKRFLAERSGEDYSRK